MRDEGIGAWIERRARMATNRVAVISGETSRSYEELASRVRRLANGFRRLGVQRGDRVGWVGPNHPAFLEALFAAGKLGAVLSPVNHRLDQVSIDQTLEDSGPRVVLLEDSMAGLVLPPVVQSRVVVGPGEGSEYERLVAESSDDPIDEPVSLTDLCMLPYTSGTTGAPKGVMLTHGNITWNVMNFLSSTDFHRDDVTIAIAPFFRVGGTGVNVLPVLFKGGTVVVPDAPNPDDILKLIERHRVTVGFGNPDILEALAAPRSGRQPTFPASESSSPAALPCPSG